MKNKVFNTPFETMLRILLLADVLGEPANIDRFAALDFICIYGKQCRVLDKNLHGNNELSFSEFTTKRTKVAEAIKLSVRNDFLTVENTQKGFEYSINNRGEQIVGRLASSYARSYQIGARIVNRKFHGLTDQELLQYISDKASGKKGA